MAARFVLQGFKRPFAGNYVAYYIHPPAYLRMVSSTSSQKSADTAGSSGALPEQTSEPPKKMKFGDWLFQDTWARPAEKDQGGHWKAEDVAHGYDAHDKYSDWKQFHMWALLCFPVMLVTIYFRFRQQPDWPYMSEWGQREAFLELARREKMGLTPISPDLLPRERVEASLPAEEELGNTQIII